MSNTAVILQYYDDTIMGKKIILKKKSMKPPLQELLELEGKALVFFPARHQEEFS